ncbi:MAG: hypothetical protein JRI71_02345 [Deltaproteobacteria bacterium]|nr:hypothetical protein [Deltaproteobacteria bacterium]MBW2076385.1 hypothetical protein [Deltaproteobacteria bacterium]
MYSIGLRYCGGCNPQIDRTRVVRRLQEGLRTMGMAVDITTDRERKVDLLLLVNGCMHACLEQSYLKEGGTTWFISVKGEMVDSRYVREDRIPDFLIKVIADLIDPPSP